MAYKLNFRIGRGNTFYDYSELVQSLSWTGRKGSAPRSITVKLWDSEVFDMTRAKVDVGEGQTAVAYLDGTEFFRGLVMSEKRSNSRILTIKAYDNCIYLANSKASFSYTDRRADQIFTDCCSKAGLTVKEATSTGKVISEIAKTSATYWDVIQEALEETYNSNGKRFYVSSKKGKLYLKRRKEQSTMPILELTTNTETYEETRSIEDTRTRLKLKTSSGDTVKTYKNTSLEKKIGKFADVQTVDTEATDTELQQKIDTFKAEKSLISESLTWSGTGDIDIISGSCVYVKLPPLGLKRIMYVDEDTHTFENGKHLMKLTLNYAKDIDDAG